MNLIRSRRGDVSSPLAGIAFAEVGGRVLVLKLDNVDVERLFDVTVDGESLSGADIWLTDDDEESH